MLRYIFGGFFLFVVAFVWSACDSTDDRYEDVTIRTDREVYDAMPPFSVTLTIENVGDESVYLGCGGGIGLEEWIDGKLNRASTIVQLECGGIDEIAPGSDFVRKTGFSTDVLEGGPTPASSDEVRYRFRVVIFQDGRLRQPIDLESQRSNEFEVVAVES